MFKKFIMAIGVFLVFAGYSYSAPLVQDKFKSIVLTEYAINPNQNAMSSQSKGLNEIVQAGTNTYVVTLNKNNRIAINKINGTNLEEYMLVNEEVVCSAYDNIYRGVGSVCADDAQNIYITYLYSDGSIKTAKIYMPSKSIIWNVPYKPNSASKYLPLDSMYYKGNLYILVYESEKNYHIVKIPSNGQSVLTIASQATSAGSATDTKYINFNAIAAVKDHIYIYGRLENRRRLSVGYTYYYTYIYIIKYDLNGVYKGEKTHNIGNGAIVRATVYNDNDVYVLCRWYNNNGSLDSKHEIMKMNDVNISWRQYTNGIYFKKLSADQNGVYVGYSLGNRSGYQRWDTFGTPKEDKFVITAAPGTVQNDAVFVDTSSSTVFLLTSLNNNNAQFTSIPSGEMTSYVYNPDGAEFKDCAVAPQVTYNASDTFTYRIKYVNYQNAAPMSGYPKLYIYDNGSLLSTNNMTIESSTNNYTDGRIYSFTQNLPAKPRYSYKIELNYGTDRFTSDEYFFPKQGGMPVIEYFEGNSYIVPEGDKNINTVLAAKMKFYDPDGLAIHGDSPVFTLYNGSTLIINQKMNSAIGTDNSTYYYYNIGTLAAGSYSYKIEAKNTLGAQASPATGIFEIKAFTAVELPQILYFEGNSHILPDKKFVDTQLTAKLKIHDPNNYPIDVNYPVFSLYDLNTGVQICSVQMTNVSDKVYQYNIGTLAAGRYKYKIEMKNVYNMEAAPAEGKFEVLDSINSVSTGKVYNAPNPFNPARGQTTTIVFRANGNENVKLKIYTPHGDKVFEDSFSAVPGTNLYEYRGRDNSGKMLYNGVYLCYLEKPSGNGKFKMLIIK
ncbi:MAG: hypothetical protein FWH43_02075 [Endomicrobia bacterium]|nr:hypothetical protein [Endomicrobiia bacterium]